MLQLSLDECKLIVTISSFTGSQERINQASSEYIMDQSKTTLQYTIRSRTAILRRITGYEGVFGTLVRYEP